MKKDIASNKAQKTRGTYEKYSSTEKAKIAHYAIQHGTSVAIRHFSKEYPQLKWSSVNDWKVSAIKKVKENHRAGNDEQVKEIVGKKRGRPSMLSDEMTEKLKIYIIAIREMGGVVNMAIVIAAECCWRGTLHHWHVTVVMLP